MTRSGVLDFFGVARAFAFALALTGLVLFLGSLATSMVFQSSMFMALPAIVVPGAFGFAATIAGVVLALICSLTRFFVARMHFRSAV